MIKKLVRILFALIGFAVGFTTYSALLNIFEPMKFGSNTNGLISSIIFGVILAIIGYFMQPWVSRKSNDIGKVLDKELAKYPQVDILLASIGVIAGFVVAYLLSDLVNKIPVVGSIISLLLYLILGYVGMRIALKSKNDIFNIKKLTKISTSLKDREKEGKKEKAKAGIPPKVLDTSVIIDGRIADICKTGFIEGKLIIPAFVLAELRHIADSSDDLKRVRGRRGLDILNMIQSELDIEVEITERDFDDISEVDLKLLKLAQVLNGKVVTNDFNLNKVAQFQGVPVLNINELANAVKPVVIPGEDMIVQVVKDGKESGQGIAYLDDGTMIVVDGGRKYMTQTIKVLVTSVLQTPAGRMIFAKPKN
ncbi:MAG: PIN/TRAM domain-containing protein [Clostridioides sp.]|nr:PIN/TRAM domain-containing protein [Clostridioides sp.]